MDVPGFEKLKAMSPNASLLHFTTVEGLRVWRDEDGSAIDLEMVSDRRAPNLVMRLRFTGVVSLKLQDFGDFPTQAPGFDVVDIGDRGWDRLFWEVLDFEESRLNFYARTAEILSVERASG